MNQVVVAFGNVRNAVVDENCAKSKNELHSSYKFARFAQRYEHDKGSQTTVAN
ncbi:hypothetical protein JK159_04020 [Weissella minor]|uniref:Uncharacterized protein n=1 Tax=Weissella minor TaxID=1620 RepID=A0A0R2JN24_9LACO|nr:hypothetical protein [Weissella minor]KRN77286.1 hypothetical protein IV67_GL001641 [Weissella minor]MBS0949540.1 hypothetical protein [Weissella minor]